ERLVELFGAIHDDISAAFPKGTDFGRWLGYGKSNLQSCQDAVEHFLLEPRLQMERLERGLSMLLDQDRLPSTAGLLSVLELCRRHEYPLLARLRRSRPTSRSDRRAATRTSRRSMPRWRNTAATAAGARRITDSWRRRWPASRATDSRTGSTRWQSAREWRRSRWRS